MPNTKPPDSSPLQKSNDPPLIVKSLKISRFQCAQRLIYWVLREVDLPQVVFLETSPAKTDFEKVKLMMKLKEQIELKTMYRLAEPNTCTQVRSGLALDNYSLSLKS